MSPKQYTVRSVAPASESSEDQRVVITLDPYLFYGMAIQILAMDRDLAALQQGAIISISQSSAMDDIYTARKEAIEERLEQALQSLIESSGEWHYQVDGTDHVIQWERIPIPNVPTGELCPVLTDDDSLGGQDPTKTRRYHIEVSLQEIKD